MVNDTITGNDPYLEHSHIVPNKGHNIWRYTSPLTIFRYLYGRSPYEMEIVWGLECSKTFSKIPPKPVIVSASQMAVKWNCSHVTAKRLMQNDNEWINVNTKHFVHKSQIESNHDYYMIILNESNAMELFNILEKLKTFPCTIPAFQENITKTFGMCKFDYFSGLIKIGVLRGIRTLFSRRFIYFVHI